jgi:hypothetical protein
MAGFRDGNCVKRALVLLYQPDMRSTVHPHDEHALDSLLTRVRGEFREMPGMQLTVAQAARLWHLDAEACQSLLSLLVEDGFLVKTPAGAFVAAAHTE